MWFAVYRVADGALMSSGSSVAETLPAGRAVKTFATRPDDGFTWNPVTKAYDIAVSAPSRPLTRLEFMRLFTLAERGAIRAAGETDAVIADFLGLLDMAQEVVLSDSLITDGLAYLVQQSLVSQARADEILGAA